MQDRNMIRFNEPFEIDLSLDFLSAIKSNKKYCGDGPFTKKCHDWFDKKLAPTKNLLTTSCTHALEISALLINIRSGDEVILPSFTFVSTASAFALRGAKLVFVDVRPDTMNIDEKIIESAITKKTRAIVVVHYAGVACDMNTINSIAQKHNLFVIEDAAQGLMGFYEGKPLGTLGDFGTISFHETKNFHCGEGGLLTINSSEYFKKAEMIREKGTDRSSFLRGEVDKYTWQCLGSSYLPSEFNAAFLSEQLDMIESINNGRVKLWDTYFQEFQKCAQAGKIEIAKIPDGCVHNAHMFYIKLKNLSERSRMIDHLKKQNIQAVSHYVPLHSSPAGKEYGYFFGEDKFTTREGERLLRLPMHNYLSFADIQKVVKTVESFF